MRHKASQSAVEFEGQPMISVVEPDAKTQKREEATRPETEVLGWEPRRQRLETSRAAGCKV